MCAHVAPTPVGSCAGLAVIRTVFSFATMKGRRARTPLHPQRPMRCRCDFEKSPLVCCQSAIYMNAGLEPDSMSSCEVVSPSHFNPSALGSLAPPLEARDTWGTFGGPVMQSISHGYWCRGRGGSSVDEQRSSETNTFRREMPPEAPTRHVGCSVSTGEVESCGRIATLESRLSATL